MPSSENFSLNSITFYAYKIQRHWSYLILADFYPVCPRHVFFSFSRQLPAFLHVTCMLIFLYHLRAAHWKLFPHYHKTCNIEPLN